MSIDLSMSVFSYKLAAAVLIVIPALLILFHIANLFGLVPVNIVWTGRISSSNVLSVMGGVSILLNAAYIWFGLVRLKIISNESAAAFANKAYPWLFGWLIGNTVVNLFSETRTEVIVFTPILVILTICCYRIRQQSDDLLTPST